MEGALEDDEQRQNGAETACTTAEWESNRVSELLLWKHEIQKHVMALEKDNNRLRALVMSCGLNPHAVNPESDEKGVPPRRPTSAPSGEDDAPAKKGSLDHIATWNQELVSTVEALQKALLQVESDSRAQAVVLGDAMEQLTRENDHLRRENDALKSRVADDVLRQRQTCRIEMATERAKQAARVRVAGQRRLEWMEATLMESHDDLYHVQRWDAKLLPQRDVSLVFHYVANVKEPPSSTEAFVLNVYDQVLASTCRKLRGYRVAIRGTLQVFAFQSASNALQFSAKTQEELLRLPWPARVDSVPTLSTVIDNGDVVFRGPRIHTCVFACQPGSAVSPATGRYAFFGPDVHAAVDAALECATVGDIVVNELWCRLYCEEMRLLRDSVDPVRGDVSDLRETLGPGWSVITMAGTRGITAAVLPKSLHARRGVPYVALLPTPKYPCLDQSASTTVADVVGAMKGRVEVPGKPPPSLANPPEGTGVWSTDATRVATVVPDGAPPDADDENGAVQLLTNHALRYANEQLSELLRHAEVSCASLEAMVMESNDRFAEPPRTSLPPGERAFVCTVDTEGTRNWSSRLPPDERDAHDAAVRGFVLYTAQCTQGVWLSGNGKDVFAFAFRLVEHVVSFVTEVYTMVNRTTAHATLSQQLTAPSEEADEGDVLLVRVGIVVGPLFVTRCENTAKKGGRPARCTGPLIRASAALCERAHGGEILATDQVLSAVYASKDGSILHSPFNVTRRWSVPSGDADGWEGLSVVYSLVPKDFAHRRSRLMKAWEVDAPMERGGAVRAAVSLHRDCVFTCEHVESLVRQQRECCEAMEAAQMAAEDQFEVAEPAACLFNRWMLVADHRRALSSVTVSAPLGLLFCDLAGTTAIARVLSDNAQRRVKTQYHSAVQRAVAGQSGFVLSSDVSSTRYVAVFSTPHAALEVALDIQQSLLRAMWPPELRTVEDTLLVRDAKTGVTLFNGPRARTAVHMYQRAEKPRVKSASPVTPVSSKKVEKGATAAARRKASADADFLAAVEELTVFGRHACGGEIRLSRAVADALSHTWRGHLLLRQLSMVCLGSSATGDGGPAGEAEAVDRGGKASGATASPVKTSATRQQQQQRRSTKQRLQSAVALVPPSTPVAETPNGIKAEAPLQGDNVSAVPRHLHGRFAFFPLVATPPVGQSAAATKAAVDAVGASPMTCAEAVLQEIASQTGGGGGEGGGGGAPLPRPSLQPPRLHPTTLPLSGKRPSEAQIANDDVSARSGAQLLQRRLAALLARFPPTDGASGGGDDGGYWNALTYTSAASEDEAQLPSPSRQDEMSKQQQQPRFSLTVSSPPTSPASTRRASPPDQLLIVAKELLASLLTALRVGNEHLRPPLPAVSTTLVASSRREVDGMKTTAAVGGHVAASGSATRTSSPRSADGAGPAAAARPVSGSGQPSVGKKKAGGGRLTHSGGAPAGSERVDPYTAALDYLHTTCLQLVAPSAADLQPMEQSALLSRSHVSLPPVKASVRNAPAEPRKRRKDVVEA